MHKDIHKNHEMVTDLISGKLMKKKNVPDDYCFETKNATFKVTHTFISKEAQESFELTYPC